RIILYPKSCPLLSPDGKLYAPYKSGGNWYFEGYRIDLSFPQCSQESQFAQGAMLASSFLILFVIVWAFKTVGNMIKGSFCK
ncbi:hypothetical protein, partial [Neisseria meningitidis]|uniref:hypothetical protein n=1 Tax=Neisseria meningitidis TaxID=487 RepID=UPI001E584038